MAAALETAVDIARRPGFGANGTDVVEGLGIGFLELAPLEEVLGAADSLSEVADTQLLRRLPLLGRHRAEPRENRVQVSRGPRPRLALALDKP
mmetsp:Transcript_305/g.912  ORF Transcript_305/g.912 Transcript_305/m.912 type:complete len:93 (-) Transcript_305:228-506(-)